VRPGRVLAHAAGAALEIAGDDVPADPAAGEVVEGRDPAGEGIGVLVGQIGGDAETKMARRLRHGGHQQERIEIGRLRGPRQGRVGAAAVDVVLPEHVGEENSVEEATLGGARQIHPVVEAVIGAAGIARVPPQAGPGVARRGHLEGVQPQFSARRHRRIRP
jgi:hypothetical protein